MTDHFDKSVRRTAYSFIAFMLIIMLALMSMSAIMYHATNALSDQSSRLEDILNIVDRELAVSWNINSKYNEYTVDEGLGIILEGEFICTPEAIEVNPRIQFESTLRPEDPMVDPAIHVSEGTPVQAEQVCQDSKVEFTLPWRDLDPSVQDIVSPAIYHIDYKASTSDGWKSAYTTSNNFIIIKPAK